MPSSRVESDLKVLYEDNHVIAVVKPARMPIQGDESQDCSLMDAVKAYLKEKYQKPGNVFLGLVHRLDRPVSGIVVFAKTSKAASRLSESFRTRRVHKIYHALVEGELNGSQKLTHYLRANEGMPVEVREATCTDFKEAVLEYRSLECKQGKTLVEVILLTGRKHQIRAQLSYVRHPIVGDKKYGSSLVYKTGEIALRAVSLHFPHPVKDEIIQLEHSASLWT